jgi:phosphoribosyl-AMP cyclohydrolase
MLRPDFEKCNGLVPVIAQDNTSGDVLMLAYMNEEAYDETLKTEHAVYFSRSRNKLWRKGEESGNVQIVKSIFLDCDADTILIRVEQIGEAACHEGYKSCFFRKITATSDSNDNLEGYEIIGVPIFDPKNVYKK